MQLKQENHITADVMRKRVRYHSPGQPFCTSFKRPPVLFDSEGNSLFDDFGRLNSVTIDEPINESNNATANKTTKQRIKEIFHKISPSYSLFWEVDILLISCVLVSVFCAGFMGYLVGLSAAK